MTTFHSKSIGVQDVRLSSISSIDPDAVGLEVCTSAGEYVFDILRERSGKVTICFGQPPAGHSGYEIELEQFREMIERCLRESGEWERSLREPNGFWDERDKGTL